MKEIMLTGLSAENPLAFLAALGAAQVSGRAPNLETLLLSWSLQGGHWKPVLHLGPEKDEEGFLEILTRVLGVLEPQSVPQKKKTKAKKTIREVGSGDPTTSLGEHLKEVTVERFGGVARAEALRASPQRRRDVDLLLALATDAQSTEKDGKRFIEPTHFSKQNGNGGRKMLSDVDEIMLNMTRDKLRRSLFLPWDYGDEKRSLGWDPADVKRYSLRANDPAEESLTMHGANLLAYEGLSFFPVVLSRNRTRTTGTERLGKGDFFTWGVWREPLSLDVVKTLLGISALQEQEPKLRELERRGISAIFRAEHFTFGKYPRFRPAFEV